jgi:hypothetical protein
VVEASQPDGRPLRIAYDQDAEGVAEHTIMSDADVIALPATQTPSKREGHGRKRQSCPARRGPGLGLLQSVRTRMDAVPVPHTGEALLVSASDHPMHPDYSTWPQPARSAHRSSSSVFPLSAC